MATTRQPLTAVCHFSEPKDPRDRDGIVCIEVDCGFQMFTRWFYDDDELRMLFNRCVERQGMPQTCADQAVAAARDYLDKHPERDQRDYALLVDDEFDCDVVGAACTTAQWPRPNWPILLSALIVVATAWMCFRIL
jgi:hypothetical protein